MNNILKNAVLDNLKDIQDPSQKNNIVDLGFVKNIEIRKDNLFVTLEVPSHRGPSMEPIRKLAEESLKKVQNVASAHVLLTSHDNKEKDVENFKKNEFTKTFETNVKRFLAVASGKGGVGKSTTASNLAIAMKLKGLSVGLLDADIYGPSQPRMMGISGRPSSAGGDIVIPLENYGVKLMSMGLLVPDDTAMIWRGPMVQSALTQMLDSVAWGDLDLIIIDLPPGTGDIQISLAQQVNLAGAVIVSTPQDIALLDVQKALTMFQKANVPILGMIENMSYWTCPDCGRVDHIFGKDGVHLEAKKRNLELLGQVPLSAELRESSDSGIPMMISNPKSIQSEAFENVSKKLIELLEM